jgi:lipopolysaccharide/colanic/teichoic acid biosynthesis glycosyltransferase
MQRFFDICFSAFALLILSPLLVPIAIVLRFTGEGNVFYLQKRIGRGGGTFNLCKFATMLKNSPSLGTGTVTVKDDPRILPAGRFLRKTKINELPQLLNILLGDMSVIGPRPLTKQTFDAYGEATQSAIAKVRPGLSGIGSIIFRGEEDILAGANGSVEFYKNTIAPYKGSLETWYISNHTLANYFKSIVVTAIVVFLPNSQVAWKAFKGLPEPPEELKEPLNYLRRDGDSLMD